MMKELIYKIGIRKRLKGYRKEQKKYIFSLYRELRKTKKAGGQCVFTETRHCCKPWMSEFFFGSIPYLVGDDFECYDVNLDYGRGIKYWMICFR